ncbi:ATP-binding protein [Aquabacterium sp.]|uniref:ATP-binding protein n=1 Tax=Aquabacterium sp. TaxID=1872578 RepID=UPI0035B4C718
MRTLFSFSRPWQRWLAGLLALALAALVVLVAGNWAEQRETAQRRHALRSALDMHAQWLRDITRQYAFLPVLAGGQADVLNLLVTPQDGVRQAEVNRYLEAINARAGAMALFVMDVHGRTLAASNWQTADSFVGHDYSRRPYVIQALAGRTGMFYGVGMTTGKPGLFIAEPLRVKGRIAGVLAVKVALDTLNVSWTHSPEPVLLRDAHGVSFMASRADWRYHRTRPLTPAEQTELKSSQAYGPGGGDMPALVWRTKAAGGAGSYVLRTEVDGRPRQYLAEDLALPEFNWTLTVLSDRAAILQTRNEASAMTALALALLAMASLYWRLRERRFAEQKQARIDLEQRVLERTRELRDAHAFRDAMGDSLLVGMRARDMDGTIIYVNRALCQMVGYSTQELMRQKPPYPYWHPDDMEKHWIDSDAALHGLAEPTGFESRIRHKDGHDVITMVYTAPLIDADNVQRGWMSSVVDITAQKQAEARERLQQTQLQRSARLASLGEMASSVAHELNQPLMALSNFAAAAKALARSGAQDLLQASLDDIQGQARRASEIVRRIRSMVRQDRGVAEEFLVDDWVKTVLGWLKRDIQSRQVRVQWGIPPNLPPLTADRVLAEQLLMNLLQNALQALDGQPMERRVIELAAEVRAGHVWLKVADHGPGVRPEDAPHLFDPFFTTKADGLGLGLNICRSIVESQGGSLHWQPRPGGGAQFEFSLPLHPSSAADGTARPPSGPSVS